MVNNHQIRNELFTFNFSIYFYGVSSMADDCSRAGSPQCFLYIKDRAQLQSSNLELTLLKNIV